MDDHRYHREAILAGLLSCAGFLIGVWIAYSFGVILKVALGCLS